MTTEANNERIADNIYVEPPKKLAFLVSGGGSNMQAILDAINAGKINAKAMCVISSKEGVMALERAKQENIPTFVVVTKGKSQLERDRELSQVLQKFDVDYIILAGYLSILSSQFVKSFEHKILNIHPALLPKFGGVGMYGHFVHEAVIAAGEKVSGATVHYVDSGCDTGEIIGQMEVAVLPNDTAETLASRVLHEAEHKLFPKVLAQLCNGNNR